MTESVFTLPNILAFLNVVMSSVLIILSFSLMAYTLTYQFREAVARRFALLLLCVMITYASEVALTRVTSSGAEAWLRFEWIGIALLPAAAYFFSLAVLRLTNFQVGWRRWLGVGALVLSALSIFDGIFGSQLVGRARFTSELRYLEAGPLFGLFALYFGLAITLSLVNLWTARQRSLTARSRTRMTYLLVGFAAPAIGVFPYLIGLSLIGVAGWVPRDAAASLVLALSLLGNASVAPMLVLISYVVAYFGVLTPDRVVRYRLIRFFTRGPIVAIVAIVAIQTLPTIDRILGLPRDIVLYTVITGVIVLSQLILSVSKSLVDRLIYRGDRKEIAWLRELDRRLLTTSDLRQFLENNLVALCELLRVPAGLVAATQGPDLVLEAVVGPGDTRDRVLTASDWNEALGRALSQPRSTSPPSSQPGSAQLSSVLPSPILHKGFWVWPLLEPTAVENFTNGTGDAPSASPQILGLIGLEARAEVASDDGIAPSLSEHEAAVVARMMERVANALLDRKLQQNVFITLQRIIPGIEETQRLRGRTPYATAGSGEEATAALLDPSPIHDPEFADWVRDALKQYWGGPKFTRSPLLRLRTVAQRVDDVNNDPSKALRETLDSAIERLKPAGQPNLSAPEWLLYNILNLRYVEDRKVRETANKLSMSESDLYRKQRVAIEQVARVLTEMEQETGRGE